MANRKPLQSILHIITLCALVLELATSIGAIISYSSIRDPMLIPLLTANCVLVVLYMIANGYHIHLAAGNLVITDEAKALLLLVTILQLSAGLMSTVFIVEICLVCCVLLLLSIFAACLLYSTATLVLCASVPILIFGFICELVARILTCQLILPQEEAVTKYFEYEAYFINPAGQNAAECIICLGKIEQNELVSSLKCHESHLFHTECLLEWVKKQSGCPICRQQINFVKS